MRKYGTLLLVDDEKEIGEILSDCFKNIFEKVIYCDNAIEAFGVVRTTELSLIITDFNMPQMSGQDFVVKLRASGYQLPVVFLTAYATKELAITAMRLGVADIIDKPFEIEKLRETVDRVLEIEKRKVAIYQSGLRSPEQQKKIVGLLQVVNQNKKS